MHGFIVYLLFIHPTRTEYNTCIQLGIKKREKDQQTNANRPDKYFQNRNESVDINSQLVNYSKIYIHLC